MGKPVNYDGSYYEQSYQEYYEKHREEVLRSALDMIDPDSMGMTRDNALTLAGAMKSCGFSREDYAEVMSRSSQDKGTFAKQWDSFRGSGKHGETTEATIIAYAKACGWKWPSPVRENKKGKKNDVIKQFPKLSVKANDAFRLVCILDEKQYKSKPNQIWDIRNREKIHGEIPEAITPQEFAHAITCGQTFSPTVYSKEIAGYNDNGKPKYNYRAIEQQIFVVDIDNEEKYIDENGKHKKRCINHPLSIESAYEICKQNEIKPFFVYETFSSKDHRNNQEEPYTKFRLCFAMDKPLKAQEYGERGLTKMREWFISLFGEAADSTITDNSRLMFGTDEKDRAKLFNSVIDSSKFVSLVLNSSKDNQTDRSQNNQMNNEITEALPELHPKDIMDLLKEDLPPIVFVVDEICPEGFGILAAPPKTHKSFLALQMCLSIANSKKVLGRDTKKTKCLYFDLESTDRRPQARVKAMGIDRDLRGEITFITQDNMPKVGHRMITLSTGFDLVLENWLKDNPDVGFVVIDVFRKIRSEQKRTQQLYDHDYEDIEKLQTIASKYHICLLLVHHTTKLKDLADPFNNMSGSTAILGAADFAWVITREKRNDSEATLHITGRDIDDQELSIRFNDKTLNWEYMGSAEEVQANKEMQEFLESHITQTIKKLVDINNGKYEGTASDIIKASRVMGVSICEDSTRVGRFIQGHMDLFNMESRISVDYTVSKERKYTFTKY